MEYFKETNVSFNFYFNFTLFNHNKFYLKNISNVNKKFMKTLKCHGAIFVCAVLCLFCFSPLLKAQDKLADILDEEIQREIKVLGQQETPAYYLSYRVDDVYGYNISTSFGTVTYSDDFKNRILTVTLRVGTPQLDNFHYLRDNSDYSAFSRTELPLGDDPLAIKQVLWNATQDAYLQAVSRFTKVKANVTVKVEEEDKSSDFTMDQKNVSIEPILKPESLKFDIPTWENRMKKYSSVFLKDSAIFNGSSGVYYQILRKYFVSSNGDKIAQNFISSNASISGVIKAKDGMEMPLYESYFSSKPDGLASDKVMSADAGEILKNLIALKNAPVAEPYSGPALLSGRASGVFFHEIFGHRVEGQRLKKEDDAQTFKKKVHEMVLPASFTVYCDPLMKKYENQDLNGFYTYDDQGSKAEKVKIVENGILYGFLMGRSPIEGFAKSNGHGRAQAGFQPVSRQSNLVVETSDPKTTEELRAELIRLVKEQNKTYGYLFQQVVGGFTNISRISPNAFNVTPVLVYRIYADGRPDEIVRGVDLIGTPLSMFSQISMAGNKSGIFNGTCGAESGSVPVSCVSPMLLVKMIETQKKAKSQERPYILPRPDEIK